MILIDDLISSPIFIRKLALRRALLPGNNLFEKCLPLLRVVDDKYIFRENK